MLGGFHELIKVRIAEETTYSSHLRRHVTRRNQIRGIKTSPVCCVADIPLSELHYHSRRYGRFAIGFHRQSLINSGFNPVLYTEENGKIVHNFYGAQHTLSSLDESEIVQAADDLASSIESEVQEVNANYDLNFDTSEVESAAENIVADANEALEQMKSSLAFVKTYKSRDFEKIYAEREWRSVSEFNFQMSDIAMLLLPTSSNADHFKNFVTRAVSQLGLPKSVSIVRWQDGVGAD